MFEAETQSSPLPGPSQELLSEVPLKQKDAAAFIWDVIADLDGKIDPKDIRDFRDQKVMAGWRESFDKRTVDERTKLIKLSAFPDERLNELVKITTDPNFSEKSIPSKHDLSAMLMFLFYITGKKGYETNI
ncbi:MAG: hypothetical protein WC848_00095 [Parcubacteria group bacterium]|jgi:hypothetical protein